MNLQARLEALAGAIRNKINTMMPRLQPQGGTAGQVLAKNSANDFDASWITPAGGGVWGSITGTLSSQTDLQTALNLKQTKANATFTGVTTLPQDNWVMSGAQQLFYLSSSNQLYSKMDKFFWRNMSDLDHTTLDNAGNLVTSGNITLAAAKAITINAGGTAKGRMGSLPGINDWMGVFMNVSFNGAGWVLDDTTKYGAFYKIDVRASSPSIAFWKIPTGAGTHTDESQMLGMDLATGNVTVNYNLTVGGSVTVADQAYGAGWDGNLTVPTKNAVYDKIQSLSFSAAWGGITGSIGSQADLVAVLNTKVDESEVDIVVSNYVSLTSGANYNAYSANNETVLTIAAGTAGRAYTTVAKAGDFIAEMKIDSAVYDIHFYLSAAQAAANAPVGQVAGIEAYDGYMYDLSGTGDFRPIDPTLKLFFHRVGTTIDVYAGPTFQTALYRKSITCPAGALYVNFSTPGYPSYGGNATLKVYDVAVPSVFSILTLAPHRSIGMAIEGKAGLVFPSFTTGLQVGNPSTPTDEYALFNQFNGSPFRLTVNSRNRGKWTIGDISANNPTRVTLACGTLGTGTFSGFEFSQQPYFGANPLYHAGNFDLSTLRPKGLSGFCSGKPAASEVVAGAVAPYALTLAAGTSTARASAAATASTVFVIKKNGTQVGTITFAAAGVTATVAITTAAVAAGDLVTITAPATPDATLSDISFLLRE